MKPRLAPPPLPKQLWTVATSSGLLLFASASSAEEAIAKVHGATAAWLGIGPLAPANDNARQP